MARDDFRTTNEKRRICAIEEAAVVKWMRCRWVGKVGGDDGHYGTASACVCVHPYAERGEAVSKRSASRLNTLM